MLSWRTLEERLAEHQRKKDLKLSSFNIYAGGKCVSCIHVHTILLLCVSCVKMLSVFGRLCNRCHRCCCFIKFMSSTVICYTEKIAFTYCYFFFSLTNTGNNIFSQVHVSLSDYGKIASKLDFEYHRHVE